MYINFSMNKKDNTGKLGGGYSIYNQVPQKKNDDENFPSHNTHNTILVYR